MTHKSSNDAVGHGGRGGFPIMVFLAATVGVVSLFLPAVSASMFGLSDGNNFFEEAAGEGVLQAVLLGAVLVGCVLSGILRRRWVRTITAVLGIVAGLFSAYVSLSVIAIILVGGAVNSTVGATVSVGAGSVLLAVTSIVLVIASILALRAKK